MPGHILLTPADPEMYSVGADVVRAVRVGDHINLLFQGRDPENGETYEGAMQLQCRTGEQSIEAEYTNYPPQKTPEKRRFTLVGSFLDTSFDYFEGTWIEPDFTLACTIEDITVEKR